MAAAAAAAGPNLNRDQFRPVFVLHYDLDLEPHQPGFTTLAQNAGLAAVGPFRDCSVGGYHLMVLPSRRGAEVLCEGRNYWGQLGVANVAARNALRPTAPPLSAAAVRAGAMSSAALQSNGTVHTWGREDMNGRDGSRAAPAAVGGLPPVVLLAVARFGVLTISAADEAYAWGTSGMYYALPHCDLRPAHRPTRIAALSGLRISRLACGTRIGAAETSRGTLLVWNSSVAQPVQCGAGEVRFPLRDLGATTDCTVCTADAAGAVWVVNSSFALTAAPLPQRRRAVRLAARHKGVVALTAAGELWDMSLYHKVWRSISTAHPELPLGLVPYGGSTSPNVVLASDHCGGRRRLALFARITVRLAVPSDPVRDIVVPFMVLGVYITGPSADPFGWLAAAAGAAAQG